MYREIILSRLREYLEKKKWKIKKSGKMIMLLCPYCKKEPLSANIIPNTSIVNCFHCKKKYNLLDIAAIIEEKFPLKAEEQLQYLKELLKIDVVTKKDEDEILEVFEFYEKNGFDLVPIMKNGKAPIEKDWTNKSHKDKNEWFDWIKNGLNIGVKTGTKSGITVIDIDQKPIPDEVRQLVKNVLIQETKNGYHLFFKYEEDLPKTRINDLKIDIENNGGQVVLYPSIVEGVGRKFLNSEDVAKMPSALKKLLLSKIDLPNLKTNSEKIVEDIKTEDFKIKPEDFKLKNNNLEGCCNSSWIKLGGILRKEMNLKQTEFVLNVLNTHLLEDPMEQKAIRGMVRELDKYVQYDEEELALKVLQYMRDAEDATRNDVVLAVMGTNRGEEKKRIDKILNYLVREGYLTKRGRSYHIIKKVEWEDNLIDVGKPVNFKVPYFDDIGHFNWGDLVLIGSLTEKGKCFAKGTGILMYDGSIKKVEDITIGDKVMGIDSTARNVLNIGQGRDVMYEIIPNRGGNSFIVNSEHILSLKKVGKDGTINMSVKEFLKQSKSFQYQSYLYRVPIEFDKKEVPIDPYFLGLWLGDGDSNAPIITTKDKKIVDYLYSFANRLKMSITKYVNANRCNRYAIIKNEKELWNFNLRKLFKDFNLFHNKHIPNIYKINDRQTRLQILAGLVDSDGYLPKKSVSTYILSISERYPNLMKDVVYLIRSLGFLVNVRMKKTNYRRVKTKELVTAYNITITGNIQEIPVKLERKKVLKNRKYHRNPLNTRFHIKKLVEDNYYGFVLDGDHLHMIDTFIVNHNTHMAMNIVKRLVKQGIVPYYIGLEAGSRYGKIALQLGLKEGDFLHPKNIIVDPTKVVLEQNAVTIIDWLMIVDKAKSVDADTPILIKKNNIVEFVPIKDLTTNHKFTQTQVMSQNGWTNIKGIIKHKNDKKMYRIITKNTIIETTEDHSLFIKGKKVTPKELIIGDKIEIIPYLQDNSLDIDLDWAWLHGFISAEGAVPRYRKVYDRKNKKISYFTITNNNKNLLLKCQKILQKFGILSVIKLYKSNKNTYVLQLRGKTERFCELLSDWHVNKDGSKKIPYFILKSSLEAKQSYLDGYISGDGHIYKNGVIGLATTDKSLFTGISYLLKCLNKNFTVGFNSKKEKNPNWNNIYSLKINKGLNKVLQKNPEVIKDIQIYDYKGYVYDIETKEHTFAGGCGYLVNLHNTDLVFSRLVEQLGKSKGFLFVFQQLKGIYNPKGELVKEQWFAPNMATQFPSLAAKYSYTDGGEGTHGEFVIDKVRERKTAGKKIYKIPCVYNWQSKELKRIDELDENKGE